MQHFLSSRTARLRAIAVSLPLLVNAIFPTKNYYWDGISFAQTIEDAGGNLTHLIHPNHLVYNFIGWTAYQIVWHQVRALYLLQGINILFAAIATLLIFEITREVTKSDGKATLLAMLFCFAGTWWRFATDANAYIPSVTLLVGCAWLLVPSRNPRPLALGFLHGCAMLTHELAILFYPAAMAALWYQSRQEIRVRRRKHLAIYIAVSGLVTASVYAVAYFVVSPPVGPADWVTGHAENAHFSFGLRNLPITLRSWGQLFLAGRPSLVRYSDVLTILLLSALLIVVAALLLAIRERRPLIRISVICPPVFAFSAIWILAYALFLLIWLPNNTFYKLFALPAVILAIASCSTTSASHVRGQLRIPALCVALLALSNLVFAIIPYSSITANQAVAFAVQMRGSLEQGAVVYFRNFNTDDWLVRYFNPGTEWKPLASKEEIAASLRRSPAVWLDTTAIDYMLTLSNEDRWLQIGAPGAEWRQLVTGGHRIRFVRVPSPDRTVPHGTRESRYTFAANARNDR